MRLHRRHPRRAGRDVRPDRRRVAELAADGADRRAAAEDGRARRHGGRPRAGDRSRRRALRPISYELPVASAQVKSCVLLAGLYAGDGPTVVVEPARRRATTPSGCCDCRARACSRSPRQAAVWPVDRLAPLSLDVPGDFSSAAPLIVAATLARADRSCASTTSISTRRRTGLLDVLERMGARVAVFNRRTLGRRAGGRPEVRSAELTATAVKRRRGAAADRRAAAVRARRGDGARREPRRRRAGVARKRIKSDRNSDKFPESLRHPRSGASRWLRG